MASIGTFNYYVNRYFVLNFQKRGKKKETKTLKHDNVIFECTYFNSFKSITYGSHFPIKDKMVPVEPQTCRKAVQEGKIVYEGQEVPISPDTSRTFQYYRRGFIKTNGACTTEAFTINNIYFTGSVELRTLRVSITTTRGVVNNAGVAVFVNGLRGSYKDSIIRDDKVGTMVWSIEDTQCHEHISEIYLGEANIFRSKQNRSIDSIIILSNNKTQQYGG